MATTHTLPADTRMEDLPGLASGDTIALCGHVLTCGSNLSAITGLYATGTGTIRLLNGGNADFSGSNPLPSTVTIEGGTEDTPLPAHGDYGYVGRAAAVLTLRAGTNFAGNILSHCVGNSGRVQAAIVVASTSSTISLDREVDWEAGDVIGWTTGPQETARKTIAISSLMEDAHTILHTSNTVVPVGALCLLLTAGLVIKNSNGCFSGQILGDEVGLGYDNAGTTNGVLQGSRVNIRRYVVLPTGTGEWITDAISLSIGSFGHVGILQTMGGAIGWRLTNDNGAYLAQSGPLDIGVANAGYIGRVRSGHSLSACVHRVLGGTILSNVAPVYGRSEYVDVSLPATLYSSLSDRDELVIRTTKSTSQLCVVHRAGGIATLVDRTDIEIPTSLPDAWRLDPIEDGTAWHDVPMTVLPGKTLSCIWYWMLGEEGATAGCQILDGEGPGWGSIAMNPGMAEVLAETAVPDGASPLRPFVAVPISWRNPGREIRKVVLRGWARGGTAYSRIDPAAGGLA